MQQERREVFPDQAAKRSLISIYEAEMGLGWMWAVPSCFLSCDDADDRELLSYSNGVKDPLEVPEVICD